MQEVILCSIHRMVLDVILMILTGCTSEEEATGEAPRRGCGQGGRQPEAPPGRE